METSDANTSKAAMSNILVLIIIIIMVLWRILTTGNRHGNLQLPPAPLSYMKHASVF